MRKNTHQTQWRSGIAASFLSLILTAAIVFADNKNESISITKAVAEKSTIVDQAYAYLKDKPNGVAILISDGYKDEATGKQIADAFKGWFLKDYGIHVAAFIDAPEKLAYSGVSFIVKDQPFGPYSLLEAKAKMPDIAAAYDAKTQERIKSTRTEE